MPYARELREQLPRLTAQMNGIVNGARKTNRGLTSQEREKFHSLENDYSNLENKIQLTENSNEIQNFLDSPHSNRRTEALQDSFRTNGRALRSRAPEDKVFSKFLRHGFEVLDGDERGLMNFVPTNGIRNTMSTTSGTQGGYIVPQGFSDMLEEAKKWFGGIEGTVGKFSTETGQPMPWPTINDTQNRGRIIGQNVQVTETDFVFSQVLFNAYIFSSDLVLIPLALIEDSYFDLDTLTARLLGTRLGRLFNYQMTVGTGTNAPTGIQTAAITAGNVVTFPTGETTSITYNNLIDIEGAVDPAYRYNPSTYWMFPDAVLKNLKKLVDANNRPLWQPGLTSSFREGAGIQGLVASRPTVLDHPYIINNDLPAPTANSYSVLFGDLSTYMTRTVGDTTVMRLVERYADYLQVGFTAFQRADGQLVNAGANPICVGQQSST